MLWIFKSVCWYPFEREYYGPTSLISGQFFRKLIILFRIDSEAALGIGDKVVGFNKVNQLFVNRTSRPTAVLYNL